jgi:hypothetical protein
MKLHLAAAAATLALAGTLAAAVTTSHVAFQQQGGARVFPYEHAGLGSGNQLDTTGIPALEAVPVDFRYLVSGALTPAAPAVNAAAGAYGADFRTNGGSPASKPAPFFGVPEPETWALLVLGFGMVGLTIRRRRSTSA